MSTEVEPWARSAQADFQAAGHRGASLSDLHTMCLQIEDMIQSIALGLNELTEVVCSIKDHVDQIESFLHAQQSTQDSLQRDASSRSAVAV